MCIFSLLHYLSFAESGIGQIVIWLYSFHLNEECILEHSSFTSCYGPEKLWHMYTEKIYNSYKTMKLKIPKSINKTN